MLLELGGRPSQEIQHEHLYLPKVTQGPKTSANFDIELGRATSIDGQEDPHSHWTKELQRVHEALGHWTTFLGEHSGSEGNDRLQHPWIKGPNRELRTVLAKVRQWRAFHEYHKRKTELAAERRESTRRNISDVVTRLEKMGMCEEEQRPGLINLYCQLDTQHVIWETAIARLDWTFNEFTQLLQEALPLLSVSDQYCLRAEQAKDADVIRDKLERLSGTRGRQTAPKQKGGLLQQLLDTESLISGLSDNLHEWKEILPSVVEGLEKKDDFDDPDSISEEIEQRAITWWKHLLCRRELKLKESESWISCWSAFSHHWDNVRYEERVWSHHYTAQEGWRYLGVRRQKHAQKISHDAEAKVLEAETQGEPAHGSSSQSEPRISKT